MKNTREILAAIAPEPSDYPNPLPPLGFSGDVSVNPLTAAAEIEAALTQVNQQLTEFVASANFQGDLQTAFGVYTDVELGATIIEALSQGETPNLKVLSAASMNGADGAFDSLTGTVYLSEGVIHSEKLVDVITEEFGHYIDSQLNEIDSPGDEGELFMRLVNGEALSEADITGLRNKDDWGLIWVEGEPVAVQMAYDTMADALNVGVIESGEKVISDRIGFGQGRRRDRNDYYRFTISEESEFNLTLDGLRANANVQILDRRGSALSRSNNPGRRPERISTDLDPGDYFVRVFPVGNARTPYRLAMSADPITVNAEDSKPGIGLGRLTEATPVNETGDVGFGTGRRRDTQDWYNFTLPVDSDVNLTLDRLRANLDVDIYDERDLLVARGGNRGRRPEKIELEGLEAGTYYVKVTPVGNARSNYRLGITAATAYIGEYDTPEDAFNLGTIFPEEEAKTFNDRVGFTEGRSGRDQRDWVRFQLAEDGLVDINLTNLSQDINMRLYDGDAKSLLETANEKDRANENISADLKAGVYYVEVFPNGTARSPYRLSINSDINPPLQEFSVGDLFSLRDNMYTNSDRIGFTSSGIRNTTDRYEFTISRDSEVDINLTGLRENANIELREANGSLLFASRNFGQQSEQISQFLPRGAYSLNVIPVGTAKTIYDLDIMAIN
ncbi:hypothetical membrane protein [Limnospira platensis NIES-39]|nr:hypothetical membrane protein [Arthrospira platensis NIES-39]BDT16418.1 hypothetical membrane protein [Arthrospira platensis NIES-39]